MSNSNLDYDLITFGKYKDKKLNDVLRDRPYCKWLLTQDFFKNNYEYLYNRVLKYNPLDFFLKSYTNTTSDLFIDTYQYFNLYPLEELKIELNEEEKECYKFYLDTISDLRSRIVSRTIRNEENVYDIKAPVKWLQNFETETNISRETFKTFITSYELPNITTVIEEIKKQGNLIYKGAKSYKIAKENSVLQELYWEKILKEKYKEHLGTQFKYEKCIFDFINIKTNTIFEVKLALKDFSETQYKKYITALKCYRIIYLIDYDCVINIQKGVIYTTNKDKYTLYQYQISHMKSPSKFDKIIKDFTVIEISDLLDLFGT
uniref:Uncharacterized protein n=1 Tax=viral metagenome TaxID=1070528 RepID=A0A6C0CYU9_9ZZZZ